MFFRALPGAVVVEATTLRSELTPREGLALAETLLRSSAKAMLFEELGGSIERGAVVPSRRHTASQLRPQRKSKSDR